MISCICLIIFHLNSYSHFKDHLLIVIFFFFSLFFLQSKIIKGDRPFCCPMPNCRRRFATEPEVKKHIDNHMNPHASKSRRLGQMSANAASNLSTSALAGVTSNLDTTKTPFQLTMDKQSNIIPRMGPTIKHELYFPQCYGPPFNQAFNQAHGGGGGGGGGSSGGPTSGSSVPSSITAPTVAQ